MAKDRFLHIAHFFFLFTVLSIGIIMLFVFKGMPDKQFLVIEALGVLYFFWGCLFHRLKGDFHSKIVVEYLLVAVIAVLLLRGAIYR